MKVPIVHLLTLVAAHAGPERTGVELLRDLPYAGTDNPRQTLHLMLPAGRDRGAKLPLLVYIHGGAWMHGDKQGGLRQLAKYVESGDYAGATIGYRLTGEAAWPAQIHDCKAAIRWLRGNAGKHGLDAERIGVFGHSAGGHLVAMLGTGGGVEALEGDLGEHDGQGSAVRCVVNFFGPAELLTMSEHPSRIDHDAPDSPESRLVGGELRKHAEIARQASPISHVDRSDPPMLLVHGTRDMLVPYAQSVALTRALREAGCEGALITVEGGGHGGFRNRSVDQLVETFFGRHLLGRDAVIESRTLRAGAQR